VVSKVRRGAVARQREPVKKKKKSKARPEVRLRLRQSSPVISHFERSRAGGITAPVSVQREIESGTDRIARSDLAGQFFWRKRPARGQWSCGASLGCSPYCPEDYARAQRKHMRANSLRSHRVHIRK